MSLSGPRSVLLFFLAVLAVGAALADPGSVSYEYDEIGRLKRVVYDDGRTIEYTLDDAGNRQNQTIGNIPVLFSVADAQSIEGGSITFTVVKTGAATGTISVQYATASGSATSGTDFTAASGTLSFTSTQTSKTVSVPTTQDSVYEANETFSLTLSNPGAGGWIDDGAASGEDGIAVGTISNDDTAPSFSINNNSASEGVNLTFTVTKTGQTEVAHDVSYATSSGSATSGADFTAASGTLSFTAAQTTRTFTVSTTQEAIYENNETLTATLSSPTNGATISGASGTGTINNDDVAPSFSINNKTATEGSNLTFTVTKTGETELGHDVNYATSSGSATSGTDFTAASGTLSFTAAQATRTFTVSTTQEAIYENNETLTATLSSPTNGATISGATGTGTINNDDAAPSFSINDKSASEGNNLTFTVTKTGETELTHAVNYATSSGSATSGTDFTAASGTLSFTAAQATRTFTVSTTEDTVYEGNETLTATLSSPTNSATISDGSGTGTINEDDPAPSFTITNPTASEGNVLTFAVNKTGSTALTHNVSYATASGTATSGTDFTAKSGTLTFTSGQTQQTFGVSTIEDTVFEGDETLTVNLSSATNGATIGTPTGTGTIDEDEIVSFWITSPGAVVEGNTITFTVTKSGAPSTVFTHQVSYATSDDTAVAPGDYTAKSGTLTFNPTQTQKTFTVTTIDDSVLESGIERFNVTLSNPTNGANVANSGFGSIDDNEPGPPGVPPSITPAYQYNTSGTFAIFWGTSNGTVTHYQLFQALTPSFTAQSQVYSGTGTSTSLTRQTGDYFYRVRACNGTACSGYREYAEVTVDTGGGGIE